MEHLEIKDMFRYRGQQKYEVRSGKLLRELYLWLYYTHALHSTVHWF
jgi:hypothetical protein